MGIYKKIVCECTPLVVLQAMFGLIGGFFLLNLEHELAIFPGLLVILPAMLDARGSISTTLCSRIAAGLHIGYIKPRLRSNPNLKTNILSALILNFFMGCILAFYGYGFCILFNIVHVSFFAFLFVSLIAGMLTGILLTGFLVFSSLLVFKKGIDPENMVMPLLATLGDVSLLFILTYTVKAAISLGIQ
jgi:mgtE-like transporter